jgi:hypothetical protein
LTGALPLIVCPLWLVAADVLTFAFSDGQEPRIVIPGTVDDVEDPSRPLTSFASASGGSDTAPRHQPSEEIQRWLSPPDPLTNHNMVSQARHKGTAEWFFQANTFKKWKSEGSLLWIHGKRMLGFLLLLLDC